METYLAHHGILGMKWGVRRYQNEDGTLTEAGKKRYSSTHITNIHSNSVNNAKKSALSAIGSRTIANGTKKVADSVRSLGFNYERQANEAEFNQYRLMKWFNKDNAYIGTDGRTYKGVSAIDRLQDEMNLATTRASQYASVARAATTVAGIVSGVGAVTTIGFGAIAAGQLAYSAYLKHQAKKVQNKEA